MIHFMFLNYYLAFDFFHPRCMLNMYLFVVQNVSMVNTVLATIVANAFREFSEAIESGLTPKVVAQNALRDSWKVLL